MIYWEDMLAFDPQDDWKGERKRLSLLRPTLFNFDALHEIPIQE